MRVAQLFGGVGAQGFENAPDAPVTVRFVYGSEAEVQHPVAPVNTRDPHNLPVFYGDDNRLWLHLLHRQTQP